jgi:hypothetical protein
MEENNSGLFDAWFDWSSWAIGFYFNRKRIAFAFLCLIVRIDWNEPALRE